MFEKLAKIAATADQYGYYSLADDATKLIKQSQLEKQAQLWDSLRTLFDPEHTPGVDRNTPFWKRLSKGWARGKMDRHLGLVLAIMTERTKLNEKIKKVIAPVKLFEEQVKSFYEKINNGVINNNNFRDETRELQRGLKDTLNLISNKDLKNILKLRDRLEIQQLQSAEHIKGLDEETKTNLMSVLSGNPLPSKDEDLKEQTFEGSSLDRLREWVKRKNLPETSFYEGAMTDGGRKIFRDFWEEYGVGPKVIVDNFINNAKVQNEASGFGATFRRQFAEMLRRAAQTFKSDEGYAKEPQNQPKPKQTEQIVAPKNVEKKPFEVDEKIESIPLEQKQNIPEIKKVEPAASAPSMSLAPEQSIKKTDDRKERDKEMGEVATKSLVPKAKKPGKSKPATKEDDTDHGLSTTSARLEKSIARFGRVKQLQKLAREMPPDDWDDELKLDWPIIDTEELNLEQADQKNQDRLEEEALLEAYDMADEDLDTDMYDHPEMRETFDEKTDYNPTQTRLEEYEDVQAPDDYDDDEDLEDLKRKEKRLERKIKFLEMSDDKYGLDELREGYRILSNKIEYMEDMGLNSYKERLHNADDKNIIVIRKQDGEFRVPAPNGEEEGAYYTDDKDDAISTAKVMYDNDELVVKFRHGFPKKVNEEVEKEWLDNLMRD